MIAMGRYLFKYTYASIVHNDRMIETNTFFAGKMKTRYSKPSVALYYGHVHRKILKHAGKMSFFKVCKIIWQRLSKKSLYF